jgi:hypothetical protein
MKVWTLDELAGLRRRFALERDEDLARDFGCSVEEIAYRAKMLGLGKDKRALPGCRSRPWTDEEVERLVELYADHSTIEVARILGRSGKATAHKAQRMGLLKSHTRRAQAGRENVRQRKDR